MCYDILHITHYTSLLVKIFNSWVSCLPELDRSSLGNRFTPDDTNRSRACRTEGRRAIH